MINNGQLINNRYEVVEKIGTGGMSDVYRAKDHVLGRYVAIKVLKQEFAEDSNFIVKFRTEAQSAAGLEHPNIVNIYDVGCEQGNHYIVMEYVEGITLKTYIEKKGQLSFKEALSIAIQVGRGIQAAHGKGIIHRDIKPQNVIISTEGKVKVTDFGIARVASANTINAEVMGSVHYASPEQARNGFVTNTSDIYSLGIVMYEMVTGRVPFDGESMVAVAIQHLQEEMPAPSTYAPNLPISLEKIILKCTQKNPDRRYASMDELLADLRQSLLTPDKDFVVLAPLVAGQTRVISKDELDQIQQHSSTIKPEEDEYEDDEYEDDDYDYEDDDEEEGRFLNKKMEKAVTIMGIVAAIVIVILVVYLLGSFLGVFNFGGNKKPQTNQGSSVVSEQQAEQVEMIDLRGKTFDEAKTELEERGLRIVQGETEESDEFEPGQIISQDIKEGEMVEVGTKVTVVVCASAEKAPVPDVVGLDSDIAKDKLEDAGFSVNREYEYAADVETGKVIRQDPAKSTELNKGETVTIYISQGEEKTKVPNVLGKTEADAKAALKEAGFNVGTVTQENSDTVAAGQVISQSVKGDSYAAKGESINLVISKGKAEAAKYYFKAEVKADKIFESGATNVSANIELSVEGEDEPIATWTNVTNFPYTVSKSDITGATSGTIMIEWHYTDAEGVQQTSVQEASVNFQEQ
ncbi:MAG: Stk1 family PASTA domain-containing Ser/Thr kinase [Eubacterium sp.]|nr:Stk1 family PASTA domain-containing Ser/Thr kinase [Eubacterium sp.]